MSAIIIDLNTARGRRQRVEPAAPPAPPVAADLQRKRSQRGNPYVVVNEAFHVVLFRRGSWAFRIENLETGQAWCSERRYQTEDAARSDALLAVSQLQQKTPERKA